MWMSTDCTRDGCLRGNESWSNFVDSSAGRHLKKYSSGYKYKGSGGYYYGGSSGNSGEMDMGFIILLTIIGFFVIAFSCYRCASSDEEPDSPSSAPKNIVTAVPISNAGSLAPYVDDSPTGNTTRIVPPSAPKNNATATTPSDVPKSNAGNLAPYVNDSPTVTTTRTDPASNGAQNPMARSFEKMLLKSFFPVPSPSSAPKKNNATATTPTGVPKNSAGDLAPYVNGTTTRTDPASNGAQNQMPRGLEKMLLKCFFPVPSPSSAPKTDNATATTPTGVPKNNAGDLAPYVNESPAGNTARNNVPASNDTRNLMLQGLSKGLR